MLALESFLFFLWSFALEDTMLEAASLRDLYDEKLEHTASSYMNDLGMDPTWYEYRHGSRFQGNSKRDRTRTTHLSLFHVPDPHKICELMTNFCFTLLRFGIIYYITVDINMASNTQRSSIWNYSVEPWTCFSSWIQWSVMLLSVQWLITILKFSFSLKSSYLIRLQVY